MGHVSFVFIDDGISGARDRSAKAASFKQRRDLVRPNLNCNMAKSIWEPRQIGQWLGYIINIIKFQPWITHFASSDWIT